VNDLFDDTAQRLVGYFSIPETLALRPLRRGVGDLLLTKPWIVGSAINEL
jgi:hypothetical protein